MRRRDLYVKGNSVNIEMKEAPPVVIPREMIEIPKVPKKRGRPKKEA